MVPGSCVPVSFKLLALAWKAAGDPPKLLFFDALLLRMSLSHFRMLTSSTPYHTTHRQMLQLINRALGPLMGEHNVAVAVRLLPLLNPRLSSFRHRRDSCPACVTYALLTPLYVFLCLCRWL